MKKHKKQKQKTDADSTPLYKTPHTIGTALDKNLKNPPNYSDSEEEAGKQDGKNKSENSEAKGPEQLNKHKTFRPDSTLYASTVHIFQTSSLESPDQRTVQRGNKTQGLSLGTD